MFWNLVSYDMSRLRADLRIQSPEPERIYLTLTVCTVFQQITEWNRAYWELELATCESFLQRGDLRETQWTEFRKANRRAALVWTFTMGLGGQRMPGKITEKSDV